jgi:hypothetical protein
MPRLLGRLLDLFQSRSLQALLEQFVRNDQGPNGILAGAAAGVADEWHRLLSNPRTSPGQESPGFYRSKRAAGPAEDPQSLSGGYRADGFCRWR